MKIAIVVDPHFSVPPKKYGGSERVVAYLIDGLLTLGQDITLFGPGNSHIPCRIIPCSPENIDIGFDKTLESSFKKAREKNVKNILKEQDTFDVIVWCAHVHKDLDKIHRPLVLPLNNPLDLSLTNPEIRHLQHMKHIAVVALSQKYIHNFPQINYQTFIYNGLPVDTFPFTPKSKKYISFVGKFSEGKQPHIAIEAAIARNKKLVIGARLDRFGQEYFDKYCKQYMDHHLLDYHGEVTEKEKINILRYAEVNLHPISVPETFGLAVVEAGLCGTPTIAFDKGSMRELILDGVSGYVVKNLQELLAVYPKVLHLDRKKVRQHFMKFNHIQMAKEYLALFEEVKSSNDTASQQDVPKDS